MIAIQVDFETINHQSIKMFDNQFDQICVYLPLKQDGKEIIVVANTTGKNDKMHLEFDNYLDWALSTEQQVAGAGAL